MRIRTTFVGVDAALSPHDAHPFLRYVAANPRFPHGRTGSSAPTGRFTILPMGFAILQLCSAGESGASTPTEILRCRRTLYDFVIVFRAGGVEPRPYGSIGNTIKIYSRRGGKSLPYITTIWENPGGRTTASLHHPQYQTPGHSCECPGVWYRRRESNPYGAMPGDFKSPVSTCSTTPAYLNILTPAPARVKRGRQRRCITLCRGR